MIEPSHEPARSSTSASNLITAARAGLDMFDTAPQRVEVDLKDDTRFRVAWPCIAHAMAQARAALVLLDAKMPFPAETNIRAAFEHAMTAQWILLTAGSEEPIAREVRRQLNAHSRDVASFIDLPPELLPGVPVTSSGPARSFQDLCDRFSPHSERHLYVLYRDLSGAVHVSIRTWQQYYLWDDAGPASLRSHGDQELGASVDMALALAVFLALGALEELRRGQPRLHDVQSLAGHHRIPCSLRGDDQQPHRQP